MRDEMFFVNLVKRISLYREIKGLTIKDIVQKTGIRKSYLQKIEKGEAFGITTSHLFKIAIALGVSPIKIIKDL